MEAVAFNVRIFDIINNKLFFNKYYAGEDAGKVFLQSLSEIETKAVKYINTNMPMNMTVKQKVEYESRTNCGQCNVLFDKSKNNLKVRHHCHLTGNFLDAICSKCNLNLRNSLTIPVYFHNLSSFDGNILISACTQTPKDSLSFSSESVFTFTIGHFRYFDSMLFLKSSLATLTQNLKMKNADEFKFLKNSELVQTNEKFDPIKFYLLLGKLAFPFSALKSVDSLNSTNFLEKKFFFNRLTQKFTSDEDIIRTRTIASLFNCDTLGKLVKLYVCLDVILLADIMTSFMANMRRHFKGLSLTHYVSLPHYIFDATKRRIADEYKNYKIKLISEDEKDFYYACERGIRGGLVFVKCKIAFSDIFSNYLKSKMDDSEQKKYYELITLKNNKSKKISDLNKKSGSVFTCIQEGCNNILALNRKHNFCISHSPNFIAAFDLNNHYGGCMSEPVPINNFNKMTSEQISYINDIYFTITKSGIYKGQMLSDKASIGYILIVDLTFPKKCHDLLDKFVVATRKVSVSWAMLSNFQKKLWEKLNPNINYDNHQKEVLIPSFEKLENYVIHYSLLKMYASLGIHVNVIHGWSFDQLPILKSHVSFCTEMRAQCENKFDENLFKFISNLLFGKCCENCRNRLFIKYYTSFNEFDRDSRDKILKDFKIIQNYCEGKYTGILQANYKKMPVNINRPLQIGLTILDYSRSKMLNFWYNILLPIFGNENVQILYSDTDSFYIKFLGFTENEVFDKLENYIDFSNFEPNHSRFNNNKKFKLGYVKVDTGSKTITAYIACRKKCYILSTSLPEENGKLIQKLKGVEKNAAEKYIKLDDFANCILYGQTSRVTFDRIEHREHKLYATTQRKIALSGFDVSTKVKSCGVCSTYYGRDKKYDICNDIDCYLSKLYLSVWQRISK